MHNQQGALAISLFSQHHPHPTAGSVPLVNSPLKIPTTPTSVRYPPPTLGQHTSEILQTLLGYDETAVAQLQAKGVI